MTATVKVTSSHASSMSGMREEFDFRRVLFGNEDTDISHLVDQKFCARVGVGEEEEPSLWFGKVLGVELGHGRRLLTTVGKFHLVQGGWKLELANGRMGATTEFDFVKE